MSLFATMDSSRIEPRAEPPHPQSTKRNKKAAEPPTSQGVAQFLWVDCQEQTDSRTRQAFIRSRHHRLRKETRMQKLKESIRPFPGSGPTYGRADPGPASAGDPNDPGEIELDLEADAAHHDVPVLYNSLDTGLLEAFPSLAIPTTTGINLYFRHYHVHTSKACFPLCSADMTSWLCRRAMEQPALVQVMLTTSASSRAVKLSIAGASDRAVYRAHQDALRLRSELIKSVQNMLYNSSEINGDMMILVIGLLLCIEGAEGNRKAVSAHTDGLKRIVRALGGLESVGHHALSILYCCDLFRGLVANQPPIFDITPKWVSRLRDESSFLNFDKDEPSTVGYGFFDSTWAGDIHPQLILILQSLRKLIPCYENEVYANSQSIPIANDCLLLLTHQLLSLSYEFPLTPFQETLRLSILLYVAIRIWTFQGKGCTEYFLQFLRTSLDKTHHLLERTAVDLLFWIYFMSSFASKGLECHSWCVARLIKCGDALSVDDWDSAFLVLRRFLFVSRSTDESAKEFWNSVRQSRKTFHSEHWSLAGIPSSVKSIAIVDGKSLSRLS
ncbi:uncharacterized protein N7459_005568 [Penicillium hispanicum]|uniref:uncharacterized protein n=1 Tax=Penicillium hispanicum TaxID=1080232 RepID=UPI0025420C3A|nr:uncharacterized protein N7459_005568 [Penicillium hispanicum]KAJ5579583.1 hypothetical protein N7459_005568 [Penicillium hispanicum]